MTEHSSDISRRLELEESAPIQPEVLRRLSEVRVWCSLRHIGLEWAILAAVISASWLLWKLDTTAGVIGYLVAIALIGARQHALGVLMHDGAHYRLAVNRTLNELIAELLTAWPVLVDVRDYRQLHLGHHQHLNTENDPDWTLRDSADWKFPTSRWGLIRLFLGDLFGLRILDQLRYSGRYGLLTQRTYDRWKYGRLFFYLCSFTGLTLLFGKTGWEIFVVYWIVPMLTWLKLITRVRIIAEHYAIEYDHVYRQTRTTYPRFWEKILFSPKNINYHLDHHLYPSVPFYRLPELHCELLKDPVFVRNAHLTRTYSGVLKECLRHGEIIQEQNPDHFAALEPEFSPCVETHSDSPAIPQPMIHS